jgi:hypothetical protein
MRRQTLVHQLTKMRPKLLALEKDILKYRALQSVLLLHEVESFRSFLLGSVRGPDRIRKAIGTSESEHRPQGTKHPISQALALIVREAVISQRKSTDIRKIIGL